MRDVEPGDKLIVSVNCHLGVLPRNLGNDGLYKLLWESLATRLGAWGHSTPKRWFMYISTRARHKSKRYSLFSISSRSREYSCD